jgi:mannosyltransferase OCH1-like enzyme
MPSRHSSPPQLPIFPMGKSIPRFIHQTYPTRDLPAPFQKSVDALKQANPGWVHRLYDDTDIVAFIRSEYGPQFLSYYERINPEYGATRADFFRYLLMYRTGGIYLDIKSNTARPLDEIIRADDTYLISQWPNGPGEMYATFGIHDALGHIPHGEFQQWHIICVAGHPFLKATIERVMRNIDEYRIWRHSAGLWGAVGLTGPVAYTLALEPMLAKYPHRRARTHGDLQLVYSVMEGIQHHSLFKGHYARRTDPVVLMNGMNLVLSKLYAVARAIKHRLD